MRLFSVFVFTVLQLGCGSAGSGDDAGNTPDGLTIRDSRPPDGELLDAPDVIADAEVRDTTLPSHDGFVPPFDGGALPDFPADWPGGRGWDWVRMQVPFISALSVRMGDGAPAADVNRYFDDFGATSIHLWEWGLPTAINGWLAARPGARWVSWVNGDGNSGINNMLLGGAARPPGAIGYQIGDEPRTQADFDRIVAATARVRAADPGPLRIQNFTDAAEEIDSFLTQGCASGDVDVFSYDRYSYGTSHFSAMMKFRDAAIACGIPYWRYLKSYIANSDRGDVQADSDLRWDAFSGVLAGYTGHTWFLYNVNGGVAEGIPTTLFTDTENWGSPTTPRFPLVAAINRELEVYGRAQTRLRSTGVGWVAHREYFDNPPEGFPAWRVGTGNDPFLREVLVVGNTLAGIGPHQEVLLGFFEDRYRDKYLIVMNPNHAHGRFPVNTETDAVVTLRFDFSSDPSVSREQLLVLAPEGVIRSAPISDSSAGFRIPAGDIVFLKYDTGRGFEGYR